MRCNGRCQRAILPLIRELWYIWTRLNLAQQKPWHEKFHIDDPAKDVYDIILGRDILTQLRLNLKWYDHFIEADDVPLKGSTSPTVRLGTYIFKYLNIGEIKPEEFFTNAYAEELYDPEHVCNATKRLRVILDAKY